MRSRDVHALRVGHEEVQQRNFHRPEFELDIAGMHAVRHRVECQAAYLDRLIRSLWGGAAQNALIRATSSRVENGLVI